MSDLWVDEVGPDLAETVCRVIHDAFGARRRLDPPSTALGETVDSVATTLERHGGLLCRVDGDPAGAVLFEDRGQSLALRRVSVVPHFQSRGVATALVGVAEEVAGKRGHDDVELGARAELPSTVTFWQRRGYVELSREGSRIRLGKGLPIEVVLATTDETRMLGEAVASLTRPGDVLLLVGELGAGKTTFAQGIASGLRVRGDVTSPTFVISRIHPSLVGGPALVHVDAYRLGDEAELDDLDLDAYVDGAVTVVEWGEGIAEALSPHRLRVHLARTHGCDAVDETRVATVTPVGARWFGVGVRSVLVAKGSDRSGAMTPLRSDPSAGEGRGRTNA
jgi:tRNA threonylcarbamoyladenosine biosynthesis protein TsaE